MSTLFLWLPVQQMPEALPVAWRWRTARQPLGVWQQSLTWEALLKDTASESIRDVVLFFPTSSGQLLRQNLSRAQVRQLGPQGLKYLFEEFSLSNVEQLEIRSIQQVQHKKRVEPLPDTNFNEHVTLLALNQETLSQYTHMLGLTPWRLSALLPDFLLIPLHGTQPTLYIDEQCRLLRIDEALAYPADDLAILLSRLPHLTRLNLLIMPFAGSDSVLAEVQAYLAEHNISVNIISHAVNVPMQTVTHAFNVLPQVKTAGLSPYWRAVAATLILGATLQLIHDAVTMYRYQKIAQATTAQAEQQFRQWYPEERRIVNLKRQVSAHVQTTQTHDLTALSLISRVGPIMQQARLTAQAVRYQTGTLEMEVEANNMAELEQLRQSFGQQGLKAQLGSVNNTAHAKVVGVMRVQT